MKQGRSLIAPMCIVVTLVFCTACHMAKKDMAQERAIIETNIRNSIGWAVTKDRPLLESLISHDSTLFMFNPDSKSTTVGWFQFAQQFEFWMDPRFKATQFDIRELRINISPAGDAAWYSAILDDLGEWDGKPIGWKDARWTGVLTKKDGKWVFMQMHFSFAYDKILEKQNKN